MPTRVLLKNSYFKAWVLTTRPKTLILSVIPFLMGTGLAFSKTVEIQWLLMISAMLSAFFIQIGTNCINDVYDFKNKADKETRLGPKRGIQSGVLSHSEVYCGGVACFIIAFLFGIPLILKGGILLSLILTSSIACGYLYTGGKKPLAYNGLGEVFVLLFFGLISTCTAFFMQTGYVDQKVLCVGLQLGLLACMPIAINNLRDIKDDTEANKKTLAVRFGKTFARVEITFLALLPFLISIFLHNLWPLLVLPLGVSIIRYIWKIEPANTYNIFLSQSILLYVLFSLSLGLGLFL